MRISDWSSDVCSSDLGEPIQSAIPTSAPSFAAATAAAAAIMLLLLHRLHRAGECRKQRSLVLAGRSFSAGGLHLKIGRASCRERVCQYVEISVVAVSLNKKRKD